KKCSQFLSGLLYLGAIGELDLEIDVVDHITAPSMVHTTINNLALAGVAVEYDAAFRRFFVPGSDRFKPSEFTVGADPA
ncbi:3-phosphoshikimate 1-carboxyvinyltransferase, partial [Burkholderia pseudomallei]